VLLERLRPLAGRDRVAGVLGQHGPGRAQVRVQLVQQRLDPFAVRRLEFGHAPERRAHLLRRFRVIAEIEPVERALLGAVRLVDLAVGLADAAGDLRVLRLPDRPDERVQQRDARDDHDGDPQPDGEGGD
jgi:hypothetical protein